jgi:HD-GYP domain-containing protein (c-di-GMP phosphodiesterase class II)
VETATTTAATEAKPQSLVGVRVSTLKASRVAGVDLYFPSEQGSQPQLYRGSDYRVTREDFERLEAKGIHTLYLPQDQYRRFLKQAREQASQLIADDEFTTTEKFQVLQTAFAQEVGNAFRRIDVGEAVKSSIELGQYLVQLLSNRDFVPRQLFDVMQHDGSTFAHVVGVSSYCVILGERLGFDEQAQLEEIAVGGMLHDVGKRHVPAKIIKKPGRLTPKEYAVVKEHPKTGYCDLHDRKDVTFSQLMMVYQHHERMDGKGYPVGILGEEIHPWARLCAVVDVFDGITGDRPYRAPVSAEEGLKRLEEIAGTHLDREMVKCWTATMSKP